MDLGFLDNMEIPVPEVTKRAATVSTPIAGDIRIRRSGKIEYSEAFEAKAGKNWLDIFFAHDWLQYPKEQSPNVLFLIINPEGEKSSKADVKGAGTSVFVKNELWEKAAAVFGFDPELQYVDLTLEDKEVSVPICLIPKTVQRGEAKGSVTYQKRENAVLRVLTLSEGFLEATEENPDDNDEDFEPVTKDTADVEQTESPIVED